MGSKNCICFNKYEKISKENEIVIQKMKKNKQMSNKSSFILDFSKNFKKKYNDYFLNAIETIDNFGIKKKSLLIIINNNEFSNKISFPFLRNKNNSIYKFKQNFQHNIFHEKNYENGLKQNFISKDFNMDKFNNKTSNQNFGLDSTKFCNQKKINYNILESNYNFSTKQVESCESNYNTKRNLESKFTFDDQSLLNKNYPILKIYEDYVKKNTNETNKGLFFNEKSDKSKYIIF